MTAEFDLNRTPLQGRNLIEASAGTGKTYAIAGLFVRLLLEKELRVDQILVVTFTEAATEELRDRIRRRLREALAALEGQQVHGDDFLENLVRVWGGSERAHTLLANALSCFDEAAVFTIHGFCQRILQEKAFESGSLFDTELVTDQRDLVQEVVDDFWRIHFMEASVDFLAWCRGQKVSAASLSDFARAYGRRAGLRILPVVRQLSPDAAEESCRTVFGELTEAWERGRGEVESLLLDSGALNGNRYRKTSIPAWLAQMNAYLASDSVLPCFDAFGKLCSSTLAEATKKGCITPQHRVFDLCERLRELLEELNAIYSRHLIALQQKLLAYLQSELPRRKRRQNIRAFDDLLDNLHQALTRASGAELATAVRQRYRAALIDEFQDTDPIQYGIFRALYPDDASLLFLIGDPKQAIYSFRGADIYAYLQAAEEVSRRYTLGCNYRSVPGLIKAVNTLFSAHPRPFAVEGIDFLPVDEGRREKDHLTFDGEADTAPLQIWQIEREEGEKAVSVKRAGALLTDVVADEIVRLLELAGQGRAMIGRRPLAPGDIAVLVRSNRQARQMQQTLQQRRVPSVLHGSESLFTSPEAQQVWRLLAAIAEPGNEGRARTALATEILGLSGNEIAGLAADESLWEEWLERFRDYHDIWQRQGVMTMSRILLARERVRPRLLALTDGERRLTNLLHCFEVLHQAALEHRLGLEGLLKWFDIQIHEQPERDEYQIRLETDENAVKLVTVHKSKGLEYPVVFCPFAWGGSRGKDSVAVFHDRDGELTLDLGSQQLDEHRLLAEQENLAENLRLLYVALTRARNRCYLAWGAVNKADTSAPAYLLHTPHNADENAVEASSAAFAALSDADIRTRLEALAGQCGTIQVLPMPEAVIRQWDPPVDTAFVPRCRAFSGRIGGDRRMASFTSLLHGGTQVLEMPDRDPLPDVEEKGELLPRAEEFTEFIDFPKGARAGTCLHEVFEEIDFSAPEAPAIDAVVGLKLRQYGFDLQWQAATGAMVRRVLEAPLTGPADPFRLCDVGADQRVTEMEFFYPVEQLSAPGLQRILRGPGSSTLPEAFADQVGRLGFTPVQGMMRGFIDMVFCHAGRYYLLDWKSNHLGGRVADYRPEALGQAMLRDGYLLQYHLYALALHRHLRTRLPGYRYEEHFGGIFYLFLRGVSAQHPGHGIYHDRPGIDLIAALDRYFSGAEARYGA